MPATFSHASGGTNNLQLLHSRSPFGVGLYPADFCGSLAAFAEFGVAARITAAPAAQPAPCNSTERRDSLPDEFFGTLRILWISVLSFGKKPQNKTLSVQLNILTFGKNDAIILAWSAFFYCFIKLR